MNDEKLINLQKQYGTLKIKTFAENDPFGSENDIPSTLEWCINDYDKWANTHDVLILSITHHSYISSVDGASTDLYVKYVSRH